MTKDPLVWSRETKIHTYTQTKPNSTNFYTFINNHSSFVIDSSNGSGSAGGGGFKRILEPPKIEQTTK